MTDLANAIRSVRRWNWLPMKVDDDHWHILPSGTTTGVVVNGKRLCCLVDRCRRGPISTQEILDGQY